MEGLQRGKYIFSLPSQMHIKTLFWWQGEKSQQRLTWNGLCKWSPCNAVMHENQIWTHSLEIQIWKQMHMWWHRTVFISITKNAALRERRGMLADSCKQMWTGCPSHSQSSPGCSGGLPHQWMKKHGNSDCFSERKFAQIRIPTRQWFLSVGFIALLLRWEH